MEKLSKWIIAHQKMILCIIILLIALSVVGSIFVKKNGDVISYLDKDTDAILGKTLLEDEFGIIGDANIAISYLNKADLEKIVKSISNSSKLSFCTKKIVWEGTFDDLSILEGLGGNNLDPEDILKTQEKAKEKFVKTTIIDDKEVKTYIISIYFKVANSDNVTIKALDEIDKIITKYIDEQNTANKLEYKFEKASNYYYIGGNAQNARALVKSSLGDMPIFIAVAVAICLIILLLTTKSYLEPIIFLATLGVSILLNMGTNLIAGSPIGTISTITSSCSIILQLALAMDYSIFFMHTYYEQKKTTLDTRLAITKALPKTIVSISASALTTVGGFVALFFMKYKMGYDLGFVLAKGVLLSLVSVIFLQPLLILMLDKPIEKCKHNWQLEGRLRPVAKHITKPWLAIIVIIFCVGIAIPSAYFQTKVPLNYITMSKENPNPNLSEQILSESENQVIMLVPYNSNEIEKHMRFIEDLKLVGNKTDEKSKYIKDSDGNYVVDDSLCTVIEVFSLFSVVDEKFYNDIEKSPYKSIIYSKLHSSFISHISDDSTQRYMLYTINLSGATEDVVSYNTISELQKLCGNYFGQDTSRITGITVGAKELNAITPTDFIVVNCVSAGLILLVLLFTFRKFLLSVVLLFVIETGIFANLSLVIILGNLMPTAFDVKINFLAYLIVSAIELGATVDYAIMVTSKFLEEKKNGASGQTAVKNAIYRSAPSVLTSGAILIIICIAIRLLTTNMIVGQITELIARGAFFSVVLVFTLLPAILSLSERAKRAIKIKQGKEDPDLGKSTECLCELPFEKTFKFKKKALCTQTNCDGSLDLQGGDDGKIVDKNNLDKGDNLDIIATQSDDEGSVADNVKSGNNQTSSVSEDSVADNNINEIIITSNVSEVNVVDNNINEIIITSNIGVDIVDKNDNCIGNVKAKSKNKMKNKNDK